MTAPQPVFDLFFGASPAELVKHPRAVGNAAATKHAHPDATRAGWCGGEGPAIAVDAWPRSPRTGFPMIHVLTLELPADYRRKGADLAGIALFQGDDHVAQATSGLAEGRTDTPLLASVARAKAARHAQTVELEDLIGGSFALIWLTAAELHGARSAPPLDDRAASDPREPGQNLNAWDHAKPETPVWLVQRAFDPNAGKAPVEVWGSDDDEDEDEDEDAPPPAYVASDAYVDVVLTKVEKLKAFYEEVHGRSHLGGTCLPVQAMPEGLTPFFLELEDDVGGANFGGGNLQLDLESGVLDWAC